MATNMNVSIRYSTFMPVLMEVMEKTNGDVLELGPGVFSTPYLHWMCERQGRNLLSIENDKNWYRFCKKYYETEHHKFMLVENWNDCKDIITKKWDVALVDHSPSGRRVEEIKILADLAKYIVAHDSDPWKDHQYHYSTIYPLFKYTYNFTEVDHNTALLSNFVDLKDFSVYKKPKIKMKNLLIYINPAKAFSPEHETLTKVQIDNSLALSWKPEDIILITNFPYEYKGIKSIIVDDYEVFDQNRSTKIPAINQLFREGKIEENTIYWFHDHDAFQLEPFDISLKKAAGFTTHGAYSPVWNAGSFFFTKNAQDIFEDIWFYMDDKGTNEQDALTYMWQTNINNINDKSEILTPAYNLGIYKIPENLKLAGQDPKVAHFHPHKSKHLALFKDILPERLLKAFKNYGLE